MKNTPIQVVVNSDQYIRPEITNTPGASKDFYANADSDFLSHKLKLIEQLDYISSLQTSNEYSTISFACVKLRPDAIAKSHRPTANVFKPTTGCSIVGANKMGELLVELTPESTLNVKQKILKAENETRWKTDENGKNHPNPSRLKAEVGAIDEILPFNTSDKIDFTIEEAFSWLNGRGKGSGYYVELFNLPINENRWDTLNESKRLLYSSFKHGLEQFSGISAYKTSISNLANTLYISLLNEKTNIIQFQKKYNRATASSQEKSNLNYDIHNKLISFLLKHPLVRKISLSPIVEMALAPPFTLSESIKVNIPSKEPEKKYPKICVVDGGISGIYKDWIIEDWDNIDICLRDESHGTFIAGLLINGQSLNGNETCTEADGCTVIDLCMLPEDDRFNEIYPRGIDDFINELEASVSEIKERTGVRIFNISLNVISPRLSSEYGYLAMALDGIANECDVIFIISAGNLFYENIRDEWCNDSTHNINSLISRRDDIVCTPAESCRNISVGALNPLHMENVVPYGLASYSRKGPGTIMGLKPDLVHIGGCAINDTSKGHGLYSINPSGNLTSNCGTSFSAPLVAKTIASLESQIEGTVSRETLMALTIHTTVIPELFHDKIYKEFLKDIIGFGMPKSSYDIMNGNDHSITLVFANRIKKRNILSFPFSWPTCLISKGKCRGHIRLTIVSTPELDYRYGEEFIRENVIASLRQGLPNGKKKSQLKSIYSGKSLNEEYLYEKELIDQTFKWSPVKVSERNLKIGIGGLTDWYLEVQCQGRDGVLINEEGIPFTVVLTIEDPKGLQPVYNEMRQNLQATGAIISDIRTATRITQRI